MRRRRGARAIGVSYPVTMLFMAVATGLNLGCSVAVSQLFGAREYDRMKTAASTSILASLVIAAILTAGGLMFCTDILQALGTEDYIFADADEYLRIYFYGLISCSSIISAQASLTPWATARHRSIS